MEYDTFKTYLTTFLWRPNDATLVAQLDSLILMAYSELRRELRHLEREKVATLTCDSNPEDLPADFSRIIGVYNSDGAEMHQRSYREIATDTSGQQSLFYYISGDKQFYFNGTASVSAPLSFTIHYLATLPAFATTSDTSWVVEDNLDLMTYATLKHTAPFLREDERVQLWLRLYEEALNSVQRESHDVNAGQSRSPTIGVQIP